MKGIFWAVFQVWEELLQITATARKGLQAGECLCECVTRLAGVWACYCLVAPNAAVHWRGWWWVIVWMQLFASCSLLIILLLFLLLGGPAQSEDTRTRQKSERRCKASDQRTTDTVIRRQKEAVDGN